MTRLAGNNTHYDLQNVLYRLKRDLDYKIEYPSVTTILDALPKYGLNWWGYRLGVAAVLDHIAQGLPVDGHDVDTLYDALKKAKRITPSTELNKAGTRGSDAHAALERRIKGEPVTKDDEANPYFQAGIAWLKDSGLKKDDIIGAEVPLFSLEHRYAGTCDVLARHHLHGVEGQRPFLLADFKTSKAIYESHLIQVAAYASAALEMGLVTSPPTCTVVRLTSNGTYEQRFSSCSLDDFLMVKKVWDLLQRFKEEAA